jgi:hypothetical protein
MVQGSQSPILPYNYNNTLSSGEAINMSQQASSSLDRIVLDLRSK